MKNVGKIKCKLYPIKADWHWGHFYVPSDNEEAVVKYLKKYYTLEKCIGEFELEEDYLDKVIDEAAKRMLKDREDFLFWDGTECM